MLPEQNNPKIEINNYHMELQEDAGAQAKKMRSFFQENMPKQSNNVGPQFYVECSNLYFLKSYLFFTLASQHDFNSKNLDPIKEKVGNQTVNQLYQKLNYFKLCRKFKQKEDLRDLPIFLEKNRTVLQNSILLLSNFLQQVNSEEIDTIFEKMEKKGQYKILTTLDIKQENSKGNNPSKKTSCLCFIRTINNKKSLVAFYSSGKPAQERQHRSSIIYWKDQEPQNQGSKIYQQQILQNGEEDQGQYRNSEIYWRETYKPDKKEEKKTYWEEDNEKSKIKDKRKQGKKKEHKEQPKQTQLQIDMDELMRNSESNSQGPYFVIFVVLIILLCLISEFTSYLTPLYKLYDGKYYLLDACESINEFIFSLQGIIYWWSMS